MGRFIPANPQCVRDRSPGVKVDRVVIHTMEGSLRGTVQWFQQGAPPRAVATAAHYLIGKDGAIVQMVPDDKKCAHANSYNSRSIGIEHEAHAAQGDFTDAMLAASAKVAAVMCHKFGFPADRQHIIGHYEVPDASHTDPGPSWPWDRYMAMVQAELAQL